MIFQIIMIKKTRLNEISQEISNYPTDMILLVYDENLPSFYERELKITNKRVLKYAASSSCKSFDGYQKCCEFFLSQDIHPKAHLISLGGGSVNDLAGFVASTLLRGISWSTIPTTLLAMIDAAIGGKVAIDTPFGKNLLGRIHHPQNIWIDSVFLRTLPQEQYQDAQGELIKYAFLNKNIEQLIVREASLEEIIHACASYKEQVVCKDSQQNNKRTLLNLGHTIGHALEMHYNISHGQAVFWGIPLEFKLTGRHYLIDKWLSLAKTPTLGLSDLTPPWQDTQDIAQLWIYVKRDKKVMENNKITLIDVIEIGKPQTTIFDLSQLKKEMEHPHFANII